MSKYAIQEAARDGKKAVVQDLLLQDPSLALLRDEDARTPLHWACTMNDEPMIELLLPHTKGDLDELTDDSGWTPVHIVAALGNRKMLQLMMARDPEPNVDLPTSTGATCLLLATSKNHFDLVDDLVHKYKCSVRAKDKKGYTAMHRAAAIGSQPMIKTLAAARANVNAKDSDGWTPLHHALAEGQGDCGVLLVQLGADVDAENNAGETPAQVAGESVRRYFESHV